MSTDADVYRGLPDIRKPRPPIVYLSVIRPGESQDAPSMPLDPYTDDPRAGFRPVFVP